MPARFAATLGFANVESVSAGKDGAGRVDLRVSSPRGPSSKGRYAEAGGRGGWQNNPSQAQVQEGWGTSSTRQVRELEIQTAEEQRILEAQQIS